MSVLWDIALPCLILMAVAGVAPYLWAALLPEGVRPLVCNGVLSAACCVAAATLIRFGLAAPGWGAVLRWAGLTALIWAPVLVLALAQQPRRWKDETW